MRIAFFGSGTFAIPILQYLITLHDVVQVVTRPDAKRGRGQRDSISLVGEFCEKNHIEAFSPESVNEPESIDIIKSKNANLAILVSYSDILSPEVIRCFELGIINIHPSLLPEYRGAEPIRWPIRKGDNKTGVTMMMLSSRLDRGNIINVQKIGITNEDDYATLTDKLISLSKEMIPDTIEKVRNGFAGYPQSQEKTFYARRLRQEDEKINWSLDAFHISCHIRSMSPTPGCYAVFKDKRVKFFEPEVVEKRGHPGEILVAKKQLVVACCDGSLSFKSAQKEGSKRMAIKDFLASDWIAVGDRFLVDRDS